MMFVLDFLGVMKIMESIVNLVFLIIGVLLTVAFELIVWPQRFIGKSEKTETEVPLSVEPKKSIGKVEEKSHLIEVYSPIHAMIVKINKKIPRESAPQGLVGAWVDASWMDFGIISTVFTQHNDKFRNKDLEMWQEIENELNERKEKRGASIGFFLNKRQREWLDELEAEYNRLKSSREDSASGNV